MILNSGRPALSQFPLIKYLVERYFAGTPCGVWLVTPHPHPLQVTLRIVFGTPDLTIHRLRHYLAYTRTDMWHKPVDRHNTVYHYGNTVFTEYISIVLCFVVALYCDLTFFLARMRRYMTWKERNRYGYSWTLLQHPTLPPHTLGGRSPIAVDKNSIVWSPTVATS